MTRSIEPHLRFRFQPHVRVVGAFDGGEVSGDAGLLPLRQFDERQGLTARLAACLGEERQAGKIAHSNQSLFRQRIYQIVAGYEDANDAGRLRTDPIFRLIAGEDAVAPLGSQPTLSRWENAVRPRAMLAMGEGLVDCFIRGCGAAVRRRGEIVLDIDSTDDPTHGQQEFSFFNGAYEQHMYHPLIVTERHTGCLLLAWLRPGKAASAAGATRLLLRLMKRLWAAFPKVKFRLRADAGFAGPEFYQFCEAFDIDYAVGIAANAVFRRQAAAVQLQAQDGYHLNQQQPQRLFADFEHQAASWSKMRRICYKAEHTTIGTNLRFVVTNRDLEPEKLFAFYNDRGECENRIEELKNGFAAGRLSCHRFAANQMRLLLHAAAYNLVNLFRLRLPRHLRSVQIEGLRNQVFKLGARVWRTARCIRVAFAEGWPYQTQFLRLCRAFGPP